MTALPDLREQLQELHKLTAQTPLFNPVFQLSLEISRALEGGDTSLAALDGLVTEFECEALQSRARHLHQLVLPVALADNHARFRALVETSTASGFDAFVARWQQPFLHIVFTAHPTFLLSAAQSDAVAAAASSGDVSQNSVCIVGHQREAITLDYEHDEAMAAIARASDARDTLTSIILDVAAQHWPDRWRAVAPLPYRLASWVGYDMDGRTDIGWATSLRYRLTEKAMRLGRYADRLDAIGAGPAILAGLRAAQGHTSAMAALFAADLSDPADLAAAANQLTADHPGKILSLTPVIAALEAAAAGSPQANALLTLAAAMRADGLGMGWIHFRVNSAQLHNAIRRRIDPDMQLDLSSQTALIRMRALLETVTPLRSNFAALAIENTTALRQFLAMVQILHHVDADAPIRMLIAEC
ncbi:MAG: hypothetical protein RL367_2347, partial [Pseudomonadota bacterium]